MLERIEKRLDELETGGGGGGAKRQRAKAA
jgi:hypothetical protein